MISNITIRVAKNIQIVTVLSVGAKT
jgi:hypothetical protein